MSEKNPFLQTENYYEGYEKKADELKNRPEAGEFDKLCYLVFESDSGKRLLEFFKDRFLLPGFTNPAHESAPTSAIYYEGFKEGFRMIISSIRAHKQRIEAESKKNESI